MLGHEGSLKSNVEGVTAPVDIVADALSIIDDASARWAAERADEEPAAIE
jgi:hypothetical protein